MGNSLLVAAIGLLTGAGLAAYAFVRERAANLNRALARADLEDLSERAPVASFRLDEAGRFWEVGPKLAEWLGCRRDELVGHRGLGDFLTAESREFFDECLPLLKSQGYLEGMEFDLVGRHGQTRRVRLSASLEDAVHGKVATGRAMLLDVTEQHRAQRRLAALAAEQRAILDTDLVGVMRIRDGRVVWRNRAAETMFGYEPGELRGLLPQALFNHAIECRSLLQCASEALEKEGRFRTQVRMRGKYGEVFWIELSAVRPSRHDPEMVWSMLDVSPVVIRPEAEEPEFRLRVAD